MRRFGESALMEHSSPRLAEANARMLRAVFFTPHTPIPDLEHFNVS